MSKTEPILVIPSEIYIKNQYSKNIKDIVCEHGMFYPRDRAEVDTTFLQIIPYIYITDSKHTLIYKRLKGGNETRLHDKYSLGFGGHVSQYDHVPGIPLWSIVESAAYRELDEELEIPDPEGIRITFSDHIIYDPSNDVGKVHLGVIGKCETSCINQIISQEQEKIEISVVSNQKLPSYLDKMENWSKILYNNVF